jgi:hypothetical protein
MLAAVAATLVAAPAAAQSVRLNDEGVSVRVGPNHRHYRDYARDCRTVVTHIQRGNKTITKRERRCD